MFRHTRNTSATVWCGVSMGLSEPYGSWKIIWTALLSGSLRLIDLHDRPLISTVPFCGSSAPTSTRPRVVLPLPLSPTRPMAAPSSTTRLASATASWVLPPNRTVMSRAVRIGSGIGQLEVADAGDLLAGAGDLWLGHDCQAPGLGVCAPGGKPAPPAASHPGWGGTPAIAASRWFNRRALGRAASSARV